MRFFTLAITIFATSTLAAPAPAPAAINPDWMGGILNIFNRPHGKVRAEASPSPSASTASSGAAVTPTPSPTVGIIVPLNQALCKGIIAVVSFRAGYI
ncbi:hypothetical protein BDV30DRAFT_237909 [Aspergillus minisclerotigenes]|uniref:Uncharacterized protein n=1 Tax=Aspergillus minisclerotigenes TaxID=656917 RepID=A0A5N6J6C9_9EURO|nr:hypothetical protein BDV30DRAFT_237909 [Aspergillus minisclerotigenes]